jgi:RNA polymerase sigma-70 factor (ECF subfamily)
MAGAQRLQQGIVQENQRWVAGTLKKLGAMVARGAVRRRLRETRWSADQDGTPVPEDPSLTCQLPEVRALPPSLRVVAMLALAGHDRQEIAWLLGVTDTALRKRISTLRKRFAALAMVPGEGTGTADLPLGLIRRALLPVVRASHAAGTHDPDGHLVVLGRGEIVAHIRRVGGNSVVSPGR